MTPVVEKKRYDTFFFLAVLPQYPLMASEDGTETVRLHWLAPEEVVVTFFFNFLTFFFSSLCVCVCMCVCKVLLGLLLVYLFVWPAWVFSLFK